MKGMILAAGYGTRFRPITYTLPKPLAPVSNRPLISYAVEAMLRAGVTDLVVNLHHLPELLEKYLRESYGSQCTLHFSFEPEILGTGGGIRKVRELLGDGELLLMNGDTIQSPPFDALWQAREQQNALAALTLRHPPAGDRFTKVWFYDGLVTGIGGDEAPAPGSIPLMFSGSHILSPRLFDYLPDRDFSGITEDVYLPLLREGREKIAGVIDDGLWFDIGTPRRYGSAAETLRQMTVEGVFPVTAGSHVDAAQSSIVADDAGVEGRLERATIGRGTFVSAGAVVRDSSVWDYCVIGEGATVERCCIGHGVVVPAGTELRDVIVALDDPAIPAEYERRDGLVLANIE
jgi:mannose-1-phosphate guanylyltransferase